MSTALQNLPKEMRAKNSYGIAIWLLAALVIAGMAQAAQAARFLIYLNINRTPERPRFTPAGGDVDGNRNS